MTGRLVRAPYDRGSGSAGPHHASKLVTCWTRPEARIIIGRSMEIRVIVEEIPFRRVAGQSSLFLSYVERSPAALSFYENPPDFESIERLARHDVPALRFPRAEVAAILQRQNEVWENDELALRRADELRLPNTVAILTGQQVGLYTGPLYTVYKAMTAVRLAEKLSERGVRAVPIFWMDTDDHDLAEVTRLTSVDTQGIVHVTDFRKRLFGEVPESIRPVGPIRLPETIDSITAEYISRLCPAGTDAEIHELLTSTYRVASSFSDAFARLMARLFRGRGLVFFDPRDPEAKALLAPVFSNTVRRVGILRAALGSRGLALQQSGFHPQVEVQEGSTLLFLETAGARRALLRVKERFVPKNEEDELTGEELADLVHTSPDRFSPNVLLRPIAQDHLFPTVAYVGGPAEIAYFAQAGALYREFGRPMPVIWPRFSATVLDADSWATLKSHGITFEDCLADLKTLAEKLVRSGPGQETLARTSALRKEIEGALDEIRPRLSEMDPTLGPALQTARRKIRRNLDRIEARLIRAGASSEIEILLGRLRPNQNLQEREFTIHQLTARYGLRILEAMYLHLRIDRPAHVIVGIESNEP